MPRPQVSIRLSTDGKAQVRQDFADIATDGSAASARIAAAWERDSAAAEAALTRLAKTQERLSSVSASPMQAQINRATGIGADQSGTARASAQALAQQLEAAERDAKQLIASIDPLFAATMRYEAQVERINAVKATGQISEERYLQLLANEKLLLDQASAAGQRNAGVRGTMRMGAQQLGFQMNDVASQMAMGTRAEVIFAQQSAQVVQALQLMGGESNAFLRFLSSYWGIALSVAVVALTPFIAKLFDAGDSVDGLVEKLKKESQTAAQNDQAHKVFADTIDGVTDALRKNREAMGQLEDADKSAAERALDTAKAQLEKAAAIRAGTVAILEHVKAEYAQAQSQTFGAAGGAGAGAAISIYAGQVQDVQAELDKANSALKDAQNQVTEAQSLRAVELGQQSAVDGIKQRYATLIEQTRQRLVAEKATSAEIERQTRLLHNREQSEIDKAQERDKKPGANAGGHTIFGDQIATYFDIANRYRGMSETGNRGTLKQFLGDVDPEKTAWCAAFVNAVLAAGGVSGSGSLAARSFLTYGKDDVASPQKGDIVIIKGAAGDHVGFLDSIDAKGNVRVLAGNTGNRVAEATYSASSVLGIRRPPTPAEAATDAQKAEDDRLKTLNDLLAASHDQKVELGDQKSLVEDINGGMKSSLEAAIAMVPTLKDWNLEYERIIAAQDEFKQTGADVLDTIFNPDNWSNWGDLGKRVLKELEAEFIKMAALNPLKNLLFGSNLPTFLDLFKGGTGITANPAAGGLTVPGAFASGTEYASGGLAWVGEFGKELVRLPRGSKVTPAAESRRIAANDGGIGSITIPINVDATGADPAAIARLNQQLAELQASLPGQIVATWLDARDRMQIR